MIPPVTDWPEHLHIAYFERVAIMHYDGKLDIATAEHLAIRDTWEALSRDQTRDQK